MKRLKKWKRFLSLALSLCFVIGVLPTAALAAETGTETKASGLAKGSPIAGTGYSVTSLKNYSIAPDVSEQVIITNNQAGTSQTVANVMEVNTGNGRATVVAGYGNRNPKEEGWTLKTTTDQAHVYEKETGLNVVGGVNASWFNINTGEPSGYLVMNGVVHHDNSSRAYLAAFDDGSVNVFREGTTLAQAEANQSEKQGTTVKVVEAVDALVAMVWDGKVVVSESGNSGYYPRTAVGVKEDGTVVLFQADGTMAPRSVGYTAEEEANMLVALGCVAAIQLDEGGSSTYISQREGEADLTMRNTPAGGSERVVSGTILVVSNVAASGEFDHAAITPGDTYYTPDSTVNLEASAMDYSGAAASSLPEDAVFTVSDDSMGTVSDTTVSGSTASAVFTSSGATGDVTVNLVSGGETVGSTVIHIQNPDKLEFNASEVNLNYNEVSTLGFKATYETELVQLKDGDIDWSISDPDAGSFADNMFTATSNVKYSGSPTVTATRGDLTASVTVNIGMEPTMILDGGDEDPWDYSTIGNTVESFDGMAANAVATYHYSGRGGVVKGSVVSDTDEEYADIVRFGHNAIKLEYDWTNLAGTDGACLGLGDNLAVDGTPTAIGVWVYIPEGVPVPWLRAQIATSTNGGSSWTNAYVNFSSGSAGSGEGLKTGWQYLEADLTKYAGAMIRINSGMLFRAMVTTGGIGWYTTDGTKLDKNDLKGYILLDNLCIVYGANNQDVTPPTVNSIQLVNDDGTKTELEDGATLDTANLRFHVTYDDSEETDPYATGVESAYFYFDGTYRGKYDRDNLGSTSGLMHFGNGLHSITFYLKDGYGNVTRETRYFTVNAEQADLPGVTLQATSQPNVGQAWNVGLTSDDLSSITSMTANVSVTRSYPVTDVVFPEGVTGTWNYDSSKGVVTIDISTIDHAVFAADQLASIVVNIPTSVAEGSSLNVQVTKGSYGCKQTEDLDISDLNQYASGFTTPVTNYPIEATYRIQADTAVVGSEALATVTYVEDGSAAAGVSVYADDQLLGTTDENGQIDISSLTATQGSACLRAADADGNCSFQITLYSYDAVGDETGAPYNITYNLAQAADGKNISWMANPAHSASKAVVEFSTAADLSNATQVEGTSRMISYSASNQTNRVNHVILTGLTAGQTYYYRVGDGTVWSDIQSFTVPVAEKETKFFLLADIQEEAALEGMGRIATQLAGQYHFGIQLGDAVDNVRYYQQWEDALKLFELDGIHDTDILHVIGNHEADDSGNDAIAAKSVFGISAPWYSVERGDVYIAVLNHTSDKDTLQEFAKWLEEDAAKTSCQWKVLVTHVPAYYTNPTGGGETYVQYLPAACDAAGIDFYFSGNDHSYARTAPMVSGEVNEDGTVYYICGSTGGKSYSIVDNKAFNFEVATLDFESVYVDVTADRYQMTVTAYNVGTDGTRTVLDQYTKRVAPICENDEHTYSFNRDSKELTCTVCGHTCNAVEEKYSGFVTEQQSGRTMYLVAGVPLTGTMHYEDRFYFADDEGFAYDGEYNICGEPCIFEDGYFVQGKTAKVLAAGRAGVTVDFILYADGQFKFVGSGSTYELDRVWNSPWYIYRNSVKKVYVDPEITALSNWAVYSCRNLTEVTFGENSKVTRIGKNAFTRCSSLVSITLPEGVTYIGYDAFTDCTALTSVYLPDGVSSIMTNAFNGDKNVVLNVAYNSYAKNWAESKGISYEERKPIELASGTCGDNLSWTLSSDGILTIAGTGTMATYRGETNIPWYAYRSMVTKVVIGEGVTKLTTNAFCGCNNLTEVEFTENSSLVMIGGSAFKGCTSLKSIELPEGMTTISGNAFKYCKNLKNVYLPDTTSMIDNLAFTGLTDVEFSVAYGSYAKNWAESHGFAYVERGKSEVANGSCGDNLSWTLSSDGILTIAGTGTMATYRGETNIPWYAYRSMVTKVVIGEGVTKLTTNAFCGCNNLTEVEFTENSSLVMIGGSAFKGCTSLKSIELPEGMTTISGNAFKYCKNLKNVYLPDTTSMIDNLAFTGLTDVEFSVAYGSYAKNWAESHGFAYVERGTATQEMEDEAAVITDEVVEPAQMEVEDDADVQDEPIADEPTENETMTSIEDDAVPAPADEVQQPEAVEDETEETEPDAIAEPLAEGTCGENVQWTLTGDGFLKIKGTGAMSDYAEETPAPWSSYGDQIKQVEIGFEVTTIGAYAFFGLNNLESVIFAENAELEEVRDSAFACCGQLKEIVLPEKTKILGEAAFAGCEKLELAVLPESIQEIGIRCAQTDVAEDQEQPALIDTFDGCNVLKVRVVPESYASDYAAEHQLELAVEQ